ncbi:MAG: GNAT family N-acetyltransferase [Cyclobacteriaceae bacterium]
MIEIRVASQDDLSLLVAMGRETFTVAFAEENTTENMNAYLDKAFTDERIEQELGDTGSQFYLAYEGSTPVGYAKVRESNEVKGLIAESAIELERIYVVSEHQGKKVGVALLEKCIEYGNQKGFHWIWLGVWEHNLRAKKFYLDRGFEKFATHPFKLGTDLQTDWLMKKRI